MHALPKPRRFATDPKVWRIPLVLFLFLLPAVLPAQDVPVTVNGIISLTGSAPIYNGPYVLWQTDFGFLWLDTTQLNVGHVQAEAKCGVGQPPSDSGIYVRGDCNGIGSIASSGSVVVVSQLSGQCNAASQGCGGPAVGGSGYLTFQLGNWSYIGMTGPISDSTQTTDPQGRTWTVRIVDLTHYIWHASGNPNAPPTANASATNTSAAGRSDKTNYFGDSWTLRDTSTSIAPITGVQWDYNYDAPFTADRSGSAGDTVSGYFPCDPPTGNFATGAGCFASVGGAAGQFVFSLKATNANGTTQYTPSPAISVAVPQIQILGFSGGVLGILTGGKADASATQGSPTAFNWTFNPGAIARTGAVVDPVPPGVTSFTLQVTYPGYTANASGTITQTDLVAGFAVSPNPVLINSTLTLTNQMQKSAAATLNSVEYSLDSGAFASLVTCPGASFCGAGGTATLTSPGAPAGNHTMALRYNYTGSSGAAQATASNPFATTTFNPNPTPIVTLDAGGAQLACGGFGTCSLQTSTNYYLFDGETRPPGINPDSVWKYNGSAIGTATASAGPVQWATSAATCTSSCNLQLTVSGQSSTLAVTIGNPPPPPPNNPSVTVFGPTSVNVGESATFSANVSNATGTVSYTWAFDDAPLPQSGGATMSHAWSSNGSHSVSVSITAANGNASATLTITVNGKPAPLGTFTATPSQRSGSTYTLGRGVEITFTADETSATQWGWDFGDQTLAGGPSAHSVKKTYSALGTYTGSLLVYGDGTVKATGPTITPFTVVVTIPAPSTAFTVQNATQNLLTGAYDAYAGATLTFTATEARAVNWGWDFGDGSPVAGKTVTHVFSSTGSYTAHLLVYGDGVNTAPGPSVANITFSVTKSPFQAMIVPGAAHLDDGTNTWGTDVSISNAGTAPMTINLAFLLYQPDASASPTLDLSALTYSAPLTLVAGGSWSATDVVSYLNGGNNKGTVVIKYSGGSAAPLVSARVYFQPKTNPGNISYGSGIPAYNINGAGQISAQGIGSSSTSGQPTGLAEKASEALEDTITVNKSGTGSGTVTSSPAGIDCGATCSASFPAGTPVSLSGSAAPGSIFVGLTGCDSIVLGQCIVSGSKTVTAQFDASAPPGNSTLTVSKAGTGSGTVSSSPAGIDCGSTCSASFASTTSVTLTATAGSGSAFAGWAGACAGTGASCVVSMATSLSVNATFTGSGPPPPTPSADQVLIGLSATPRYRFGVTLFNAAGASGNFRIAAMDEESSPLLISDGAGGLVAYRDFAIRPYQQVYLTNDDLGLTDSSRRYVVKGTRNSSTGTLLAFGTSLDRVTRDLIQITDDSQASAAEAGLVNYWVAGVSRYDSSYGAHWRTDLRIYNRGSHSRNLYFEYTFSGDGVSEKVARVNQVPIAAGKLLTYDDVVKSLLAENESDKSVDLSGSSAGILRIYYPEDAESGTRPLIIGSRNYDDQPTGTAGSQLAVYTRSQGGSSSKNLSVAGAEESPRYSSRIGVFTMDPGPVAFRIVAIDSNGVEVGSLVTGLGGAGLHFGQIDLTNAAFNFTNPGKPVTIRIDSISGGRVGAYVFTVDKVTLDTDFFQALP